MRTVSFNNRLINCSPRRALATTTIPVPSGGMIYSENFNAGRGKATTTDGEEIGRFHYPELYGSDTTGTEWRFSKSVTGRCVDSSYRSTTHAGFPAAWSADRINPNRRITRCFLCRLFNRAISSGNYNYTFQDCSPIQDKAAEVKSVGTSTISCASLMSYSNWVWRRGILRGSRLCRMGEIQAEDTREDRRAINGAESRTRSTQR